MLLANRLKLSPGYPRIIVNFDKPSYFIFRSGVYVGSYSVRADGLSTEGSWTEQRDNLPDRSSNYEVRISQTSGSTISGDALNTWLSLSQTRTWSIGGFGNNYYQADFVVEVREKNDTSNYDSAEVSLTVQTF